MLDITNCRKIMIKNSYRHFSYGNKVYSRILQVKKWYIKLPVTINLHFIFCNDFQTFIKSVEDFINISCFGVWLSKVCLSRVCFVQGLLCPGFVMSKVYQVQVCYFQNLLCLVFVMSRVCYVQRLLGTGFIMSSIFYVQCLLCLGFVMSSICYVQGLLCLGFVMSSVCYVYCLFV